MRNVVVDCNDMKTMQDFWSTLTGFVPRWGNERYVFMQHPDGRRPGLILQLVPEPASGKNRVHVDLDAADLDQAVAYARRLGAREDRRVAEAGVEWAVMRDPEGNYFCIQARDAE